jgi:hypothetical protein
MGFKLRILTFHHIPNNGSFIFSHALIDQLKSRFPRCDVKIIDYKTTRLAMYDYLKRYKLFPKDPFFYYKRYQLWNNLLENRFDLDKSYPRFSTGKQMLRYYASNSDALLVGMDVWCITKGTSRPLFPNVYWLPEKMKIPKLAIGISAYQSNKTLIAAHAKKITAYLNEFEVIGSRDRFTHELVLQYRTRASGLVERIPDPALLYEIPKTGISKIAERLGVDPNRPILGLLLFNQNQLSREICLHFHAKGFQIVALSMYNQFADINLGYTLDPFQWAEFFKLLSFCVTDRFHGTVFCIKNGIPFISLDNERITRDQSKIYDLLTDFNLTSCYSHLFEDGNSTSEILFHIGEIERDWEKSLKKSIKPTLARLEDRNREFSEKMRIAMGW